MENKNLYTKDSIQSLTPLEFTRLRPGVYCGNTEYSTQLVVEIVANAIDEFKAGNGNKIVVEIDSNNICSVRDYGQGFLINEIREDGETVLQASFDVLNTSGKFTEDGVYEGSALGLNGIGGKLTNFLSHWLEVTSYRDGEYEHIEFGEGVFQLRELGDTKEPNGTVVKWSPSEEFFTNIEVDLKKLKDLFFAQTCICQGLTIELITPKETTTFYSKNGLNDLIDYKIKNSKELITNRFCMNFEEDKNKIDIAMTYTSNYSLNMYAYVNTGDTESGPHITQIKTLLTREFNKFFKDKKWLKEKEANFSGDDLQEGLCIAFNITAPGVSYDAQTKSRIEKLDMTPFTNAIVDNLKNWFLINEKDIKLIFDSAANARRAREAAKKARDLAREPKGKKKSKIANLPTKLVDCECSNRQNAELIICEGDSAASPLVAGRDADTQAIFPIRGKMINAFKGKKEKILANQEVNNLIKALGLDVTSDGKLIYDIKKLRYGKIIAATDGE